MQWIVKETRQRTHLPIFSLILLFPPQALKRCCAVTNTGTWNPQQHWERDFGRGQITPLLHGCMVKGAANTTVTAIGVTQEKEREWALPAHLTPWAMRPHIKLAQYSHQCGPLNVCTWKTAAERKVTENNNCFKDIKAKCLNKPELLYIHSLEVSLYHCRRRRKKHSNHWTAKGPTALWEGAANPAPPGAAWLVLGSALILHCCRMSNDGAPILSAGTPWSMQNCKECTSTRDAQGDECWSSPGWKASCLAKHQCSTDTPDAPRGLSSSEQLCRKLILSRLMPHIENLNESTKWKQELADPGRNSKLEKKKPMLLSILAHAWAANPADTTNCFGFYSDKVPALGDHETLCRDIQSFLSQCSRN